MKYLKLYEGFFMHFGKRKFKADKSLPKTVPQKRVKLITKKDIEDVKYTFLEINDIGIEINCFSGDLNVYGNSSIITILNNNCMPDLRRGIEGNHTKFNSNEFIEILKFALPYLEENCGLTIKNMNVRYSHSIDTYVNPGVINVKSLDEYIKCVKNIKYIYQIIIELHKLDQ